MNKINLSTSANAINIDNEVGVIDEADNNIIETIESFEEAGNDSKTDRIRRYISKFYPGQALFDIRTVAAICSVSYDTIRRLVKSGAIESTPFGNKRLILIEELISLIINGDAYEQNKKAC